jgi:hypothetical protein
MLPVTLEKFGFNQVNITNLLGQAQFCGANTNNVTVQMGVLGPLKIITIKMTNTVGAENQDGLTFADVLPAQYCPSQNTQVPIALTNSTTGDSYVENLMVESNGSLYLQVSQDLTAENYIINHTFLYL